MTYLKKSIKALAYYQNDLSGKIKTQQHLMLSNIVGLQGELINGDLVAIMASANALGSEYIGLEMAAQKLMNELQKLNK